MKQVLTLSFFLLLSAVTFGQAERTLVKSFNLQGNHAVVLNLDETVDVQQWDEAFVRVLAHVRLENGTDNTLKALITAGRYRLTANEDRGALVLSAQSRDQQIKLRGQALIEQVSYTIFVPSDINVETPEYGAEMTETSNEVNIDK